jgi:3-deoxy-D-manno-octulosonate 8-phosphate phosphatase (KDO 8-P phosphatase)
MSLAERVREIKVVAFDFDGVFTDNSVWILEDGGEAVRCSRPDGLGLRKLEQLGMSRSSSSEANPVVTARSKACRVFCCQGCGAKAEVLDELLRHRGVGLSQTVLVGNDINDLECLQRVALPTVVQDAHPNVLNLAAYRTMAPGGHGAVREVCDLFCQA